MNYWGKSTINKNPTIYHHPHLVLIVTIHIKIIEIVISVCSRTIHRHLARKIPHEWRRHAGLVVRRRRSRILQHHILRSAWCLITEKLTRQCEIAGKIIELSHHRIRQQWRWVNWAKITMRQQGFIIADSWKEVWFICFKNSTLDLIISSFLLHELRSSLSWSADKLLSRSFHVEYIDRSVPPSFEISFWIALVFSSKKLDKSEALIIPSCALCCL